MENTVDPREFYLRQIKEFEEKARLNKSRLNSMIWIRFILFVSFGYILYLSFTTPLLAFAAITLIAAFLYAIKRNGALLKEKARIKMTLWVLAQEIKSLNNESTEWYNGDRFLKQNSSSSDLDLFGSFSLYHLINRTSLEQGEELLAKQLNDCCTDESTILLRQKSINEFSLANEFRREWQVSAHLLEDKREFGKKFNSELPKYFQNTVFHLYVPIALASFFLFGATYFWLQGNYIFLVTSVVVNLNYVGLHLKKINALHNRVSGLNKLTQNYTSLVELYLAQQWKTTLNSENKNRLQEADKAFRELEKITEQFDRRMNLLLAVSFNAACLYDLFLSRQLEAWETKYALRMKDWMAVLAEIDAVQSLGNYHYNCGGVQPIISKGNVLEFEELGHPLISVNKRIANSYSVQHPEKIVLITGSNMSGKSTFLRSIGLNLIMAQAGLPVCAKTFSFTPMRLCSSLRQSDSLENNVSLFHAELLRLKEIRETLSDGKLTLVLLDEILKGTNSEDKLHGSEKLIEEFLKENIIGFIATHDLALGEMEMKYSPGIKNACFESVIENNELLFDYKLKEGVARNKNATFLLKKLQIIP